MAGSYDDYPANRVAYDADATRVYSVDASGDPYVFTELSDADVEDLNGHDFSWSGVDVLASGDGVAFVFPEVRSFSGIFVYDSGTGGSFDLLKSSEADLDPVASWVPAYAGLALSPSAAADAYRTEIVSFVAVSARALMVANLGITNLKSVHIFGSASSADSLALWDPQLDQRLDASALDWGTTPRRSSADVQFRVKNLSTQYTAESVTVSLEDEGSPATPSVAAQHLLSSDGQRFSATLNLGDLSPSGVSGRLSLRRVTVSTASLGLWTFRVLAGAGSWT